MKKRVLISTIFMFMLFAGNGPASSGEKLSVFVSIPPQKYFVNQIGKDLIDVHVMVEPGSNPHTYEPKPKQLIALSKASLYFSIGVEFEKLYLQKILSTNPGVKLIQTDSGIEKIPVNSGHHHHADDKEPHGHDETGNNMTDHHEKRLDPHVWLSPQLVKMIARNMKDALVAADPQNRRSYEENHKAFMKKLASLDLDLLNLFEKHQGKKFMVFHPSWGYFAHTYGLQQVPVEIEGKNPKPAQLKAIIEHAREEKIDVVFAQPQFSVKSANIIAKAIGGKVMFADPLAEDWLANLQAVADNFRKALK